MDPKTITEIQQLTVELLSHMGVEGNVLVEVDESEVVRVDITGIKEIHDQEAGMLIGKFGETLRALQLILSLIINKEREEWLSLSVDVDGYKKRREEWLRSLANRTIEKALFLKEAIALDPMPSGERRIIHLIVSEHEGVLSESSGEGRERKVVITPA